MWFYGLCFLLCVCCSQNLQTVKCLEVCLCVAIVDESFSFGQINIEKFCAIHSINNKEDILSQINTKYGTCPHMDVFQFVAWWGECDNIESLLANIVCACVCVCDSLEYIQTYNIIVSIRLLTIWMAEGIRVSKRSFFQNGQLFDQNWNALNCGRLSFLGYCMRWGRMIFFSIVLSMCIYYFLLLLSVVDCRLAFVRKLKRFDFRYFEFESVRCTFYECQEKFAKPQTKHVYRHRHYIVFPLIDRTLTKPNDSKNFSPRIIFGINKISYVFYFI